MSFGTPGFWKPRPYESPTAPTYAALTAFLAAVRPRASQSTYVLFRTLAMMTPAERMAHALSTVIVLLRDSPHLVENRDNSDVFARVLTLEEFTSFREVAGFAEIPQVTRVVAEDLLCLKDRGTLSHFLSRAFLSLKNQPYIHPMDEEAPSCIPPTNPPTPPLPPPPAN